MAQSTKPLSFLFLFLLFLTFSLHVQSRESKFFSKITHSKNDNVVVESELPHSSSPAPEQALPVSNNSYSLYNHESSEFPSTKTSTITTTGTTTVGNDAKQAQTKELDESYKEAAARYAYGNNNGYSENNNGYTDNNKNYYNTNRYSRSYDENNNDRYVREREGMSDTRFVENGKYYYDAGKDQNYYGGNGYETETETKRGVGKSEGRGYYYNTEKTSENEFDTMEEYERQQGYSEIPREYVP